MKKITKFFGNCLILASVSISSTFAKSQVSDEQVYQLLDKSGATRTVESFPLQMQAMGQQMALTAKDPEKHEKFMQVFMSSIDTKMMMHKMQGHIKGHVTQHDIQSLLTWLESDLAKKMIDAELQSTAPDFQQNLLTYIAQLQSNPPTQARTQAIFGYLESAKIVEQSMIVMMSIVENMFDAAKANEPENEALAQTLDAQLQQMSGAIRPAIEQQMVLTSYYIYRDISDAELAQYSEFFQQELGQKYVSLLVNAMSEAMNDWGVALMKQVIAQKG